MTNKLRFKTIILSVAFLLASLMPLNAQAAEKVDYSIVFDADYYYNAYPDVKQAFGYDKTALLQHFISYGMKEGRKGSDVFDVKVYMENNPDLVQAFGKEDLESYYLHYISYGKKEGRIAAYVNAGNQSVSIETTPQQTVISSYSTQYNPSENRAVNIALAVAKINGVVVNPGQKFSFSDTVGPRTAANGFVVAPVFVNRKETMGIGGGICQVSSTTYAAMLEGGIKATERHPHSLPVSYIPEGMDATIAAGSKDLTFINQFDFPIVINATAENGVVTVSFVKQ